MLAVVLKLQAVERAIVQVRAYRDNLPDALELLEFDATLQINSLLVQRDYLISVLEVQMLLAVLWALIIRQ